MIILASTALTIGLVIGLPLAFGVIVLGIILLKKYCKFFQKDEKKPTEQQVVKEELKRVLEEVTDEETIKQMEQYNEQKKIDEEKAAQAKEIQNNKDQQNK